VIPGAAQKLLDGVTDLFLPRRCAGCGAAGAWLCRRCAAQLVALDGPHCRRCGRPTPLPERSCVECRGRDLAFVSAAAAFAYSGAARRLVTQCKFQALRSLTDEMAALAAPRFRQFVAAAGAREPFQVVTWVPTTGGRRVERGFDQAELFARKLAAAAGLPAAALLARTRSSAKQSGLDRAARAANVRGGFVCRPPGPTALPGFKRAVVVDDVYTTGETLNQCATALAAEGHEVHVFTFARTVRGGLC